MANPRIEEVSDDEDVADPDEMDLESFDFARPQHGSLQQHEPSTSTSQMSAEALQSMLQPQASNSAGPQMTDAERERMAREQREKSKQWQCIYPVYFDASRSQADGRRVKKEEAVANPLAREIVEALHHVGSVLGLPLQIVFEPSKCHPKDWANPGRAKVLVKKEGKAVHAKLQNKHYLLNLVAAYLKTHPTTTDSPLKLRITGLPVPKENLQPPAIPRGFKMGSILPLHSPALTGGGVSDNFLKDMMAEMQEGGQMPEGMEGMANMARAMSGAGGGGGGMPNLPKKVKVGKKR